jgi:transposase
MIKFLSILSRYEAAQFSQLEAAELLGVGERTFRRWRQRFEDDGEAGLLDRRLGKASGKRVPVDRGIEVETLYRTRYAGFTAKHFHEHLIRDHGFNWGYTWTKTFLHSRGLLERAKRRGAHRRKRLQRDNYNPGIGCLIVAAQAPAPALARNDAASGRLAARMAFRPAGA